MKKNNRRRKIGTSLSKIHQGLLMKGGKSLPIATVQHNTFVYNLTHHAGSKNLPFCNNIIYIYNKTRSPRRRQLWYVYAREVPALLYGCS